MLGEGYAWAMENLWKRYSERTKERPPRELLVEALKYVEERGAALDLGPGALNESKFLLEQGFASVTAVNKDSLESDPVVRERATSFPQDRFTYRVSNFEDFDFEPDTYDLVNAQYSLPFNRPETFDSTFTKIIGSLKKDGIITGQFFGMSDEWNDGSGTMTFLTREHAQDLLKECEIIIFNEVKGRDRLAGGGEKYWHIFDFIARKK